MFVEGYLMEKFLDKGNDSRRSQDNENDSKNTENQHEARKERHRRRRKTSFLMLLHYLENASHKILGQDSSVKTLVSHDFCIRPPILKTI